MRGERIGVPWNHNALRHSLISYRLAAIKSVDQVAMEAGNSAQVIFQHYQGLFRKEGAAEWFALGLPAKSATKVRGWPCTCDLPANSPDFSQRGSPKTLQKLIHCRLDEKTVQK